MGDIIVDSLYNPHIDEDGEIGESLPRKLYNYFFGSKNSRKPIYNTMILYWNNWMIIRKENNILVFIYQEIQNPL